MVAWAAQMKVHSRLRWNRIPQFKAKIAIHLEFGPYILKTVETAEELIESFRLRHKVFFQEFQGIEKSGLDFDRYDHAFDHLVIIHRSTSAIVGTYRLSCSDNPLTSYVGEEFHLGNIANIKGPYLELGRACIHDDHRRGAVISLLWRGIAEYMSSSGANVLFGCSSLKINDARDAALVYRHLSDQGAMTLEVLSAPTAEYQMSDFGSWLSYFSGGLTEAQQAEAEELVPSLLKSYLKLGAKIAAEPAFDRDFDCIDMLTVLKKRDLNELLSRRYKLGK